MEQNFFFGMVSQFETSRVQVFRGKVDRSALVQVPRPFGMLLHDIIGILTDNIDALCQCHQKLLLLGLQPVALKYCSDFPIARHRVYNSFDPDMHFCCTLSYCVTDLATEVASHQWEQTHSLVVDFTTGDVMNHQRFIGRFKGAYLHSGWDVGQLNPTLLQTAWKMYHYRNRQPLNASD